MNEFSKFLDLDVVSIGDSSIRVGQILAFTLTLLLGYILIRLVARLLVRKMTARQVNPDVVQLVSRVYMIAVIMLLLFAGLELLNVPLTTFAFISGAVALGVGFGAQNIINNYISGWILLWEKPIRIGDFLEVGTMSGVVEAINTRSTRVKRVDGVHVLIPNSKLLEDMVVNWTLVDKLVRSLVKVGVCYGSSPRQVEGLIQQALDEHPSVLAEPKSTVLFENFGDNALEFDAVFWVSAGGERDLRRVRSDLRFAIEALFREHGVVVAFPQRDVHLDFTSPIDVRLQASGMRQNHE